MKKNKAISYMKQIMEEHKDIELSVSGMAAKWSHVERELTHIEDRQIGYLTALAMSFDIKEMKP